MSEVTFGNSTEAVESFLLAMLAMKGGEEEKAPKSAHYQDNLRSWSW